MKIVYTFILALFLFCFWQNVSAKTIYTWTDKDGNTHITDRQPPQGAMIKDEFSYQQEFQGPSKIIDESLDEAEMDREKSEALKKAAAARKNAQAAKRRAEEAIQKAQQMKKETDEFVKKVQHKSRKRKSLQIKMQNRIEASNQAREEAEKLRQIAFEAEKKAIAAETDAESIGQQTPQEPQEPQEP
jgi:hypothetical protein